MIRPPAFPLSFIGFFAIFVSVGLLARLLPASIASYAVGIVILALFYAGPRLFGSDWYWMGYGLGVIVGGIEWMARARMTETEKTNYRWQARQISLLVTILLLIGFVIMIAMGR
jgi:hypothetical protein